MDLNTFIKACYPDIKLQPYQKDFISMLEDKDIKVICMPRRFGYYDTIKAYHEYLIKLKEAFTMKEFYIAGVQFHEAPKIQDKLKEGMQLTLRPEPSNKYDPNAVAIIYNANGEEDDTMIGYVPAKFSGEISADILTSDHITCTLTEVNLDAKTWERFKVIIKDEEVSDA